MGNKWEVYEWWQDKSRGEKEPKYHQEYSGESLLAALWMMRKLKKNGATCVKLEWR